VGIWRFSFYRKNAKIPRQCKFKRKKANIKGKTLKYRENANLKGKTLKSHDNANLNLHCRGILAFFLLYLPFSF
jgi:hypothetical protein